MAQSKAGETRVKEFGNLSPLHEEKEVSRNLLAIDPSTAHPYPLLRLWDRCSSDKSDGSAHAACSSLDSLLGSRRGRASFLPDLSTLLSHKSSTGCKSSRVLTAINPNVRISRGLSLGAMETEILNYNLNSLYEDKKHLYKPGCLCKWDVMPDEIIGHWNWTALTEDSCWYRAKILPAFEKHNSLVRAIRIEAPLTSSAVHRKLPKSLPKVFTKVMPKALTALSRKGKSWSIGGAHSNADVLPINQYQMPYGATGCGYIQRDNYSFSEGDDYISTVREENVSVNENYQTVPEDYVSANGSVDGDHDGNEFDDANEYDANGDGRANRCDAVIRPGNELRYVRVATQSSEFADTTSNGGYTDQADNYTVDRPENGDGYDEAATGSDHVTDDSDDIEYTDYADNTTADFSRNGDEYDGCCDGHYEGGNDLDDYDDES